MKTNIGGMPAISLLVVLRLMALCLAWGVAHTAAQAQGRAVEAGTPLSIQGVPSGETLNLRADASTKSTVLAKLPANAAELVATGRTQMNGPDRWIEVRHKNKVGWVHSRFVRPSSRPVLKEPSKETTRIGRSADPVADCNSDEDIRKLDGCSTLIGEGVAPPSTLAIAHSRRSDAFLAAQDFDTAVADRVAALGLQADDENFTKRLVHAYGLRAADRRASGNFEGAFADYTDAIRIDPKNHALLAARAAVNVLRDNYDDAIADLQKAVALDAANTAYASALARLHEERGVAHLTKGDADRAIDDFTAGLALEPQREAVYIHRAAAHEAKKDFDRALADYSEAERLNPENVTTRVRLGSVSLALGRHSEAIVHLGDAIERDQSNITAYMMRALAFEQARQPDQAIADYQAVLKLDKSHALAKASLKRLRVPMASPATRKARKK
jgi:tetratricopeptide (TPR) repeat protein